MDQKQPVDDDLQQAINNIANTTNIDPVFSDPVAAPSTIPEDDNGELDEPVGPFPAPEPAPEILPPAPAPDPVAPLGVITDMPNLGAPAPAPLPDFNQMPGMPGFEPVPSPEAPVANIELNVHQVKEAALRDLVPLLDRLDITAAQKFNLYRNIFENLKDYTVLGQAYNTAKVIEDEAARAEALLYIIEAIDKM